MTRYDESHNNVQPHTPELFAYSYKTVERAAASIQDGGGGKHRPFLGSEIEMSSVTLQNGVSFVSPSPTELWE